MNLAQDSLLPARNRGGDDNLIPLINIVFLLLIFFMVAGQIREHTADDLQLPENSKGEAPSPSPLKIEINAGAIIYINGEAVSLAQLTEQLTTLTANGDKPPVALLADQTLPAQQLGPVLLTLQELGFERVRLYTQDAGAQ